MILASAPVRVTLLGGGSDYPEHYLEHGGRTLGFSIDRYSWVSVNPLQFPLVRVSYSETELVESADEVRHPAVRACLRFLRVGGGVDVHYVGDEPARSGLGSSSSFTVALLHALHAHLRDGVSQLRLAEEAVRVERDFAGERVGVQDQYTCALGGLVHLEVAPGGEVSAERVFLSDRRLRELGEHLLLVDTGVRRRAHDVLAEQVDRTRAGRLTAELNALAGLAASGLALLRDESRPVAGLGPLLREAWEVKRGLSGAVSTPAVDAAVAAAAGSGALGGKLLGAGGGGMMLFLVPPERRAAVLAALPDFRRVPFGFDVFGSRVVWP